MPSIDHTWRQTAYRRDTVYSILYSILRALLAPSSRDTLAIPSHHHVVKYPCCSIYLRRPRSRSRPIRQPAPVQRLRPRHHQPQYAVLVVRQNVGLTTPHVRVHVHSGAVHQPPLAPTVTQHGPAYTGAQTGAPALLPAGLDHHHPPRWSTRHHQQGRWLSP